ncbi:metal-dependent hydrolase [Bordetella bronchialis]|uniref:Hydrolase n=1 Tax=Bordetella bronchialis TaxID=463025 RepID=A0A193FZW7_9BORD|nr:metal-dependent hydrolase [Bordetella bronchialis]ANN67644.1 hydrolase [Bordetella bronchialis]ANN72736.1 hydrolase [Bordetella bronchialis]
MDSLTHVVLGGSIQAALLGRAQGRKALLYGAVLATLPDLDVFVPYPDPVSLMTFHRGFSHSIFVLTALAALLAWLVRRRWPDAPYTGGRLFLALWLVLITHPLLDAMTTYGTQLFWPLPLQPVSISSIFIIDPVFTLPLLIAFLANLAWGERVRRLRGAALGVAAAYLAWTFTAKTVVEHHVRAALAARAERPAALFSAPMPLNSLLWRVIARGSGDTYYETVASVFDRGEPEQLAQPLNLGLRRALPPDALLARLEWFTGGWLRYDAIDGKLVVTDLRMGMPGYYTFRFVMAQGSPLAGWQLVVPSRWPSSRGGWMELRQILNRIVAPQPPLPLAAWAARTTQLAATEP